MKLLAPLAALLATVTGHGHVKSVIIGTSTYTAFLPVATPNFDADAPSIMRKIDAENPVIDVFSNDYTCGKGAVPIHDNGVARVANVNAGGIITYQWVPWPHLSPIQTWMAKCSPDCGAFTGSVGKVWFKIEEDGANPQWATQKLHNDKFRWNVTIPACLSPGQYLVRHEIVQTDSCKTKGTCHQFINCIQVKVHGAGTATPPASAKIAIPGDIKFEDPGIWWDVYKQNKTTYLGPGPRAWKCPL